MLATHYRYFATAKKPASNYFLTSSLILRVISDWVLLSFCLTSEHPFLRGSLCAMMPISNMYISWQDQANMSTYSRRSSINFLFSTSCKAAHILTFFLSSLVPRLIISIGSLCGWMIFDSCLSSLANSSRSSQSSQPSSSAWLIGKSKSYGTISALLSMVSRVSACYDYAFF